jgi:selenocysteine lyase/cysteine desulfurase
VHRDLVRNQVPTVPGGGTVAFVDPVGHRYLDDPVAREEGGTPPIVESIRAGLVFALKQAVGTEAIQASEERLWKRALQRWSRDPRIEVLRTWMETHTDQAIILGSLLLGFWLIANSINLIVT